ncbi:RNA polymerase sigma-70 factor (ECF subfamily) [Neomicrococcus aestuarii]|uniref:RNA polymerase sigma-70 factor (ECF subfamily) n=1 Tax=Neomicrococcus aestuarii TaxID=556325 RepID=A0A7W8X070_9MICC|nr:RNA polymerase sigma factor [Neomicrococcus aestuarii]MBB5512568.1 RNA polymerase sigma-70 factor (ECF subfamily) [Neomicrococcus aestuarii]
MANTLNDDVILRAQKSDPLALRAIYEDLAGKVVGYLRARGVEDAEAACQEVFLALFSSLPTLQGGVDGLRALTYSIAHSRQVDYHRKRASAPQHFEFLEDDSPLEPSAQDQVLSRYLSPAVERALAELPELQRECIILRTVVGLSIQETAAALEKSEGAIKQLQRRALESMKKSLSSAKEVSGLD